MSMLTLKYRLYPNKAQERILLETFAICRDVYNSLVNERTALYETEKKSPNYHKQAVAITCWKKSHPELKTVHSQVLQNVAVRVDLAFQAFFRRVKAGETPGFPRIKGDGYDSFTYPQSGFKVGVSSVWLSLKGKQTQVKAKLHRPIVGAVKTCTVRRYGNKWYVCFSCEHESRSVPLRESEPLEPSAEQVGIDVGLKTFAALSNGDFIENPRFFRQEEAALAKAQRKFDKVKNKHGSKQRKDAKKVVRRVHERIRNRRHDFVHQAARRLVKRFGVIAVEKLNIDNMLGNHCLAKSISDASWSMFRTVLTQKAESATREIIAVNPAYTTQDCSGCGYRPDGKDGRTKKKLNDRWHFCPMCNLSLDRDTNAAINILHLATRTNLEKTNLEKTNLDGITSSQVTPVEAPAFRHGE